MLDGGNRAPSEARALLDSPLAQSVEKSLHEHVLVLVSELVTNSVIHGGADEGDEIELVLAWSPDRLRVEVRDAGPGFGASLADGDRDGGWGLQLVERLSDSWGVARTDIVTVVWFELRLAAGDRHAA